MTIGNRVIQLLKENNLKQKDLAEYLGTRSSTVSGWKEINRNPSSELIIPICEFFNISANYLLTGENDENFADEKLLSTFHQLNEDNQDIVIGEMKKLLKEQKYEESVAADNKLKEAK